EAFDVVDAHAGAPDQAAQLGDGVLVEVLGVLDQLEPTSAGHQMAPVRGGEHQSPARPQQRRPAAESLGTVDQVLDDLAGEDGVEGSLVKGNVLGGPHHTEAHSPLTDV